jgi:hypothetical protein
VQHNESYHGRKVIVTTTQRKDGRWTYRAEVLDGQPAVPVPGADEKYPTEEDAARAGFSAAAAAVDRAGTSRGKP